MANTPEEYYDVNNELLGNYQYLSLKEVIDGFEVQSHDNQSALYGMPRHLIQLHAKAALKTIHSDAAKEVKALELTIGDDLIFKLPQDFVDYIRVSLVQPNSELVPLDINTKLNIAKTYLQDNDAAIMFDNAGDVLIADGMNLENKPYTSYSINPSGNGASFQQDTSKLSRHGEFTIDRRRGIIFFGSNLRDKEVVLEYVSDGMEWERIHAVDITFHKHLQDAVKDLTYYNCIETRTTIPYNEKRRARDKYKASRHTAVVKLARIDLEALKKTWRKGLQWVKH